MSRIFSIRLISLVSLLFIHSFLSVVLAANQSKEVILPAYQFYPLQNPMNQVEEALKKAQKQDKMLLVVLGAQWCHDSQALAEQFSSEGMQTILKDKYVTEFVDVGFLEDRRDITQRFGYPTYFGTPTVLAIDPETESLVNLASLSKWQDSARQTSDDFVNYFSKLEPSSGLPAPDNKAFNQFIEQNLARLHGAYRYLGPLLEMDENKQLVNKTGFYKAWNEVWKFRSTLQKDFTRIYLQLQGTPQSHINYPTYPEMSWEAQ